MVISTVMTSQWIWAHNGGSSCLGRRMFQKRLGKGTSILMAAYAGSGVVTLMTVHTIRRPLAMHLEMQTNLRVCKSCYRQMHV